jgi:hypothetical protein
LDLISDMEVLYSYFASVDSLKKEAIFEETVRMICEQTIECAFFIQGYTKYCFGRKVSAHCLQLLALMQCSGNAIIQPLSGMNEKIEEFRDVLTKLQDRFIATSTIHIAVVSSRILQKVEDIRKSWVKMILYIAC